MPFSPRLPEFPSGDPGPEGLSICSDEQISRARRVTRARRPGDWERDLERARAGEGWLAGVLRADPRITDFEDHTARYDCLDFSFTFGGRTVYVDLKEKRSRYSSGIAGVWPEIAAEDLFIVDETVFRRIVWQGGGGYLVVHDHPARRWAIFGPWELTLGPRVRYQRRGQRTSEFLKGKVLLNLAASAALGPEFSVDLLLDVVTRSARQRDQVEAVPVPTEIVPEVGF